MRIVGGSFRGKKLAEVGAGDVGAHLRPTTDRVRESLFNLLTNGRNGDLVRGARVLDLFAGTGALGLEALSRGAEAVTFVDQGAAAGKLIRANIRACGVESSTRHLRKDATVLGTADEACDLLFLDPPYGQGLGELALAAARDGGWIAPDAAVVWEEAAPPLVPEPLEVLDQRRYGQTTITLLKARA